MEWDRGSQPSGVRTVFVTRHGRTDGNETGIHQHWGDSALTDAARSDIERAAGFWRGRSIAYVVSSPVRRALQTAELLFGRVDEVDAAWAERACPDLEGVSLVEAHTRYPELFEVDGWPVSTAPVCRQLESSSAVDVRVVAGLRRVATLVDVDQVVAVVTHGAVLTALASLAGEALRPANLAALELRADPANGWHLVAVHDPLHG